MKIDRANSVGNALRGVPCRVGFSRAAAAECSLGRKPQGRGHPPIVVSPEGATETSVAAQVSPLRGCKNEFSTGLPGAYALVVLHELRFPLPPPAALNLWGPRIGPHRACLDGERDGELTAARASNSSDPIELVSMVNQMASYSVAPRRKHGICFTDPDERGGVQASDSSRA